MRNAPSTIPVMLGNLRQEIEAEKVLLRYRLREGDKYAVFPLRRRRHHRQRKHQEVAQLLEITMQDLWQEFKNVERPFLIKNPVRAEQVERGDYWGESDVAEKPYAKRNTPNDDKGTKDRVGVADAGLSSNRQTHYQTGLVHRFIWYAWRNSSGRIEHTHTHI